MDIHVYMYIWVDGLKGSKVDFLTRSGPKARRILRDERVDESMG